MSESLTGPRDYYETNQLMLLQVVAATDIVAGAAVDRGRYAIATSDRVNPLEVHHGTKTPDDLLADGIHRIDDPATWQVGLDSLAHDYNASLLTMATCELDMLSQRLHCHFGLLAEEKLFGWTDHPAIKADSRQWSMTDHKFNTTPVRITRSSYYNSERFVQAHMYRIREDNFSDNSIDTCLTIVDGIVVQAVTRQLTRSNNYPPYTPYDPKPDPAFLHYLGQRLAILE